MTDMKWLRAEAKNLLELANAADGEVDGNLTAEERAEVEAGWDGLDGLGYALNPDGIIAARRYIALAETVLALVETAADYEQWEADWLNDTEAWRDKDFGGLTETLYDALMDIQAKRNAALAKAAALREGAL